MGLLARAEEYLQWEAQQIIAAEQRRAKIKKMVNTTIATAKTAKTKLTH